MDYLSTSLEVKAVQAQQRIISGLAAVTGNEDRVQDVIVPGAFTKTLASKPPGDVGVFIGHKTDTLPVGIPLVIQETPAGLYTETLVKPGPAGDDLLATAEFLQRHGKALGMSIGYRVHPGGAQLARGAGGKTYRKLTSVDLMEFSYAAAQAIANPMALVMGVKAMPYHIERRDDQYRVLKDDDDAVMGTHPTKAEAEAQMRALYAAEGRKTVDPATLPDAAFLYIQPGGVQDNEGCTIPRAYRHFPYRDGEGKVDAALLRQALAALPTATAPGLAAKTLMGRVQRMLANLADETKVVDTEAPEWQHGVVPALYALGHEIAAVADTVAAEQKAMRFLGQDVQGGQVMRPEQCAALHDLLAELKALVDGADLINAGQANQGQVALYRARMRAWDLMAS